MKKINLGCGEKILEGWENYDKYPKDNNVKYIDLNKPPFPQLPNNYADLILLNHVYEHLNGNQIELMQELSRILKKGGRLIINVPVNYPIVAHEKMFFTNDYFLCLKEDFYGNLFSDIKVTWKKNNFRNILWKIKLFFNWITKGEVSYELQK